MKKTTGMLLLTLAWTGPRLYADEPDQEAMARGQKALFTRAFTPAAWTLGAYDIAWKHWQPPLKEKPANYDQAFREYYGMHQAPFDNGRYPLGMREGSMLFGKGLAVDCMSCHGGSILGKSHVGLGNSTTDLQALYEDMGLATGTGGKTPFIFSNVRGTSEAAGMLVFLISFRDPDLKLRLKPLDLGLRDDLCEDTPAWWHLRKKKTMYHTGSNHARSVRALMQFMLMPTNTPKTFATEEATFRDIQAFILSLRAPKYPFPIDAHAAAHGQALFTKHCASCHGTYGEKWTYPNKVVAIDLIGTDRTRFEGLSRAVGEHYNQSWFGKEPVKGALLVEPIGYQAPPLDGVWATAPYFHNGSVPTLEHVLNSKARPKIFTRSFRTDEESYDKERVGWKVQMLEQGPDAKLPGIERRRIYDTTQPGRGNGGHTFGDKLTDRERQAVIEYLKTL